MKRLYQGTAIATCVTVRLQQEGLVSDDKCVLQILGGWHDGQP
jgi:hypothetical protein